MKKNTVAKHLSCMGKWKNTREETTWETGVDRKMPLKWM
jgi:hypothetical protein